MTILRAFVVVALTVVSTACTPPAAADAATDSALIDATNIDSPSECTPLADASPVSDARVDVWPYGSCPADSIGAKCNFGTGYFGQSIDTTCIQLGGGAMSTNTFCTTPCHDDPAYCPFSNLQYRIPDGGPEAGVDSSRSARFLCARLASECQSYCFIDCSADPLCPAGARCAAVTLADAGTAMFCVPD